MPTKDKPVAHPIFRRLLKLAATAITLVSVSHAIASDNPVAASESRPTQSELWQPIEAAAIAAGSQRVVVPNLYKTMRLNRTNLANLLAQAPMEFTEAARTAAPIITLPMPDGTLARFTFVESPIIEPGLAVQYPEFKTYSGQGIDDPTATARFDWMPNGFHAMVLSPSGTVMVDPYALDNVTDYSAYWKHDAVRSSQPFICHVGDYADEHSQKHLNTQTAGKIVTPNAISGTQLRTYRLALAATNEYAAAVGGGTVAGTLAAEVVVMNRVNGVFERELAIRMVIIANNNLITFASNSTACGGVACTATNDPYSNDDGDIMLGQNQSTIDSVIGTANYDIGHVFSTGGGGIATLQSPCRAGLKARGVTGMSNPVGDVFAIDLVAHEIGHQWGANHTFNTTAGSCGGGNREQSAGYEPGSGVTIMAYAGICSPQNLANSSIDTFHVKSLEEMISYSQSGLGNNCGTKTATGNLLPVVNGPGNFTIPKGTPFALTATVTDGNTGPADSITYDWQQYDLDAGGVGTIAIPNTDADDIARPIFRPYLPTTSGTRTFPQLPFILNNANVPPNTTSGFLTGELLPAISRTMNFQVVARDNRANGGGIGTATSLVTIDGATGPFAVTAPNTAITVVGGTSLNVTWNAAGTTAAPVSAANVKISLSTDGGNTFPTVLSASTPNTGSKAVTVPNSATTTARIKVEAVGNIFFDISNTNFTITAGTVVAAGPLDVDASDTATRYDPATDGVLVLRYMLGLTGTALTANATGGTASRTDPTLIKNHLDGIRLSALDVDGDNTIDALTDGLLIVRYMLNIRGAPLVAGAVNPAGSRKTFIAVEGHLGPLMPQ